MFLPSFFFEPPERRAARQAAQRAAIERRIAETCQDWTPTVKWAPQLCFRAATFNAWAEGYRLFGAEPLPEQPKLYRGKAHAVSPDGKYAYVWQPLPRGAELDTFCGSRKGSVVFDGDVQVATLVDLSWYDQRDAVWMSLTPMEVMSLRPGTKKATGHVVVAGLGLGYQLIEVSRRKKVSKITLVELSQSLVDWLMPELQSKLGPVPVEVIVGDARQVLPTLTADVALVDIARGYGGNTFWWECKNIRTMWVWGAGRPGDGG